MIYFSIDVFKARSESISRMEQNWCVPLTPQHWPSTTEQRGTNIHKTHMQSDICCRVNRQPAEWPRVQCNQNRNVCRACVCLSKESYIFTQSLWCVISFCHYWMTTWRDKHPYRESPSDSVRELVGVCFRCPHLNLANKCDQTRMAFSK